MKVHTKIVLEWKDSKYQRVENECEAFDYEGTVTECKGGGGTTETVQKSDPWEGMQPYLSGTNGVPGLYSEAAKLYNQGGQQYYQGDTLSPQASETSQSQQMTSDIANQGSQGNDNLQQQYADTMGGNYLYGGQGFNQALQAASNKIIPQIDSRFAMAGRSGSGLAQTAQTQALSDSFAGLYNDERGRQIQMSALAPQINQMRYADANTLGQLGAQKEDYQQDLINQQIQKFNFEQNAPYDALNRYAQILNPGLGVGGTQTSAVPTASRNRAVGAIGGAASGAMMGSYIMPGWGTAIGGLLGGALGGWG